ncbi:TerC family protein [Bacillus sp. H-16]|uniref:TerC family protein n=1 Tax=Alteribacter keqinensis TaxID=2483800 RepID=A0A3M7TZM6_9BACI|nr:TerC family protein [Alteribacter salitolerans]RNA69895.1 TerC family protein [Alteribacter keqinensis]
MGLTDFIVYAGRNQPLNSDFFVALLTVIGIDLILGGDNAIVVAMACRKLPPALRNKAIVIGIAFAILARGFLTIIAIHLLSIPYLMGIGGVLLFWIAYKLLTSSEGEHHVAGSVSVFAAIKTIVIADVVMGFDNVLAVAGAADGDTLIVFLGLLISVPILIWGSKIILFLMKKFPVILYAGAAILAFTASAMISHEPVVYFFLADYGIPPIVLSLCLITAVVLAGFLRNRVQTIVYFKNQ